MRKRDNSIIKNVDFNKLNEILRENHIKRSELSRRCGYDDSDYVRKTVFGKERLNRTVANTLERVYGISPDEYSYKKIETTTSDDDMYTLSFSFNGKLLKRLALKSIEENITVQDFVFKCIIEGIGDKILEEKR